MRSVFYSFPRKSQWIRDSKIGWRDRERRQDKVVLGIDDLVQSVNKTVEPQQLTYLYCELYFALNFWLRNFPTNRTMNAEREPAIKALHVYIELLLMRAFRCPHRMLRAQLQKYFGKVLDPHGVWCDRNVTYSKGQFEVFRVVFEAGRAYSLDWRTAMRQPAAPVPVDTVGPLNTGDYSDYITGQTMMANMAWAFFVLNFDRDMYIAPHCDTQDLLPDFHSSYTGGVPVQFSGAIQIENGYVGGVRNNSGHYKPNPIFFPNILSHLKLLGVDLKKVELVGYEGGPVMKEGGEPYPADEYLADKGRWELLVEREQQLGSDRRKFRTAHERKKLFEFVYPDSRWDQQMKQTTRSKILQVSERRYHSTVDGGRPASPQLWRETFKGVCDDLLGFIPKDASREQLLDLQAIAAAPSPPPRPRVKAPSRPRRG